MPRTAKTGRIIASLLMLFGVNAVQASTGAYIKTSVHYEYDELGNIIRFHDEGNSDDADDDVYAEISYSAADATCRGRHILDKAVKIVVKGEGNKLYRHREGTIDCGAKYHGSLTELRQYFEGGHLTHALDYDAYGNLVSVSGPEDERGEQTQVSIAYDETVHTYPEQVTNHFGLSNTSTYDYAFGKKLSRTDTNGNTLSYTLDKFGRIETVTGPYQQGSGHATIAFEYHPEAMPAYAITRHYDRYRDASGADTIDTVLFTDGLKRVVQTKKDAGIYAGGTISERMIISGRTVFDALGRTVAQYQPDAEDKGGAASFKTDFHGHVTRTEYDALDRTVKVTLPDNSITETAYELAAAPGGALRFVTTVTDAEGHVRESYRDVRELITLVREYEGSEAIDTAYAYDALKQITDVFDAKQNHTSVDYDRLGRRLGIDNPDTGKVSYAYDVNGNLRHKLTEKLEKAGASLTDGAIEYVYDHDRLTHIHYPNVPANDSQNGTPPDPIDVTYAYGENTPENAKAGRVGRIIRVDHQSGYEERWYGKLGEVIQERKWVQIPGDLWHSGQKHNQGTTQPEEYEVFTTQYEYDTFGRLQNMVFPDGEKLTYHYNAGGLPQSVHGSYKRSPYPYVELIGYDEYEQRVRVELGNGAKTDYRYDEKLRRLDTLQTLSDGYQFQNLEYDYDKVGNILGLKNNVEPPTSGMGGYVEQTFGYDSLNRLTSASGTYQGDPDTAEYYSLAMSYDAIHNITRKNQKHWVEGLESNGTKHGTSYDWHYAYNPSGTDSVRPHAPIQIGVLDDVSGTITGRTFAYDANGNQLGWTNDKTAGRRTIEWDDENRIQSIDDKGKYSQYSYDDAGERVIKQSRQNLTVYVNQYFTERNGSIGSKHIFVGDGRVLTKVTGGTQFIRSYDGVTGAKTPPGQAAQTDKTNHGKAGNKNQDKSNNGKHLGQQKNADKANNGKAKTNGKSAQANNNTKSNNSDGTKRHGVNGLAHRSDRANEVAQNTCKNKHLRDTYCDENGNGIPDSEEGSGTSGAAEEPFMEEIVRLGSNGEQLFYYHSDHLGSTGYVTRENGQLHEHIQYFPFGETWVQQGGNTEKDPYLFTSKELDEETGLYYFGARYYDPRTSVWASADPILEKYLPSIEDGKQKAGVAGGVFVSPNLNLYAYAHNRPVILKDPDGNYVEAGLEVISIGLGTASAADNFEKGNYGAGIVDSLGVAADTFLLFVPIAPGTIGLGIQGIKNVDNIADAAGISKDALKAAERLGVKLDDVKITDGVAKAKIDVSTTLDPKDIEQLKDVFRAKGATKAEVDTGFIANDKLDAFLRRRVEDGKPFNGGTVKFSDSKDSDFIIEFDL